MGLREAGCSNSLSRNVFGMGRTMSTLDEFAQTRLDRLSNQGLLRAPAETRRLDGVRAERGGRILVSFCCNDYLNLTHHPAVMRAARAAIAEYGAGSGASRLVTGNHPLHKTLETALARLKGTDDSCVMGSGYLTNAGAAPCLVGPDDLIVMDELSHASAHAGARLSRAEIRHFAHNDPEDCRRILRQSRAGHPRCMIITEGVFSMDGDRAPLVELSRIAAEYDSWLMVDDAHGTGVLGGGRGSEFEFDPRPNIELHMGTLSKALGGYGGFLCASRPVIELMRSRARSLVYSTGLPPSVIAGAIAALEVIDAEPDRVGRPLTHARIFTRRLGLPEAESPIVPIVVGAPDQAVAASASLEQLGYLVIAIRPPTVPDRTARLRFTFTADHTEDEIAGLADAVTSLGIGTAR
jgi:8-amino-7-oxononanoate synthase